MAVLLASYVPEVRGDVLASGAPFSIHSDSGANRFSPSVARAGNGRFVVVWHEWSQVLDIPQAFARRYERNGEAVGTEFLVDPSSPRQVDPEVAAVNGGGFVVVWLTTYVAVGSSRRQIIRARLFDGDGAALVDPFQVDVGNTTAFGALDNEPRVSTSSDGSFIVTWARGGDASGELVFGQRMAADGTASGSEISFEDLGNLVSPVTGSFADGGFVLDWAHASPSPYLEGQYEYRSRQRLFDADGQPVGPVLFSSRSSEGAEGRDGIGIGVSANDEYVVTWSDGYFTDVFPSGPFNVFAERRNRSGQVLTPAFQVNTRRGNEDEDAGKHGVAVDVDGNGAFTIVWGGDGGYHNSDELGIFGQRFDASGSPEGTEFRVTPDGTGYPKKPAIAADETAFMAVWQVSQGVMGRMFDIVDEVICGDANVDGGITASDALIVLVSAVTGAFCNVNVCDTLSDSRITATDALRVLQAAVQGTSILGCFEL